MANASDGWRAACNLNSCVGWGWGGVQRRILLAIVAAVIVGDGVASTDVSASAQASIAVLIMAAIHSSAMELVAVAEM